MIVFDQLRISNDGKQMFIDIHVNTMDAYSSIYLDSLTIVTADKVSETMPDCATNEYIYKKVFDGNLKEASLIVDKAAFDAAFINTDSEGEAIDSSEPTAKVAFGHSDLNSDLFFVYVECKTVGSVDPCFECLPCQMQEMTTLGTTFNTILFYQRVMDYTKELADSCNIPTGFADFILLWNIFKAAIQTGHYIDAKRYWEWLFGNDSHIAGRSSTKRCGCHG